MTMCLDTKMNVFGQLQFILHSIEIYSAFANISATLWSIGCHYVVRLWSATAYLEADRIANITGSVSSCCRQRTFENHRICKFDQNDGLIHSKGDYYSNMCFIGRKTLSLVSIELSQPCLQHVKIWAWSVEDGRLYGRYIIFQCNLILYDRYILFGHGLNRISCGFAGFVGLVGELSTRSTISQ